MKRPVFLSGEVTVQCAPIKFKTWIGFSTFKKLFKMTSSYRPQHRII